MDDSGEIALLLGAAFDTSPQFWLMFRVTSETVDERPRTDQGDGLSLDSSLTGEDAVFSGTKPLFERRADQEAEASLIPSDKRTSFISRIAPLYSKDRLFLKITKTY